MGARRITFLYLGRIMFFGVLCFISSAQYAAPVVADLENLSINRANYAQWIFAGVVSNEHDEQFGYFFQMRRDDKIFHVVATLVDLQTKQRLFLEEDTASLLAADIPNWQVGGGFLRFNPLNDSWVFGFKTANKQGFNFKVDLLKETARKSQELRHGVNLRIGQTSQLSGHIKITDDNQEQFVTANKTWLQHIERTDPQAHTNSQSTSATFIAAARTLSTALDLDGKEPVVAKPSNLSLKETICQFNDGSGFYYLNMPDPDALRGSLAGWLDASGTAQTMTQFINVNEPSVGHWSIQMNVPKLRLFFDDVIKKSTLAAGIVVKEKMPGFCVVDTMV